MSTVHCGTDTAPNGAQHTLLALHRDTVGTFGTATGNDNQFWKSFFVPVQFHKSFRDCIASSVPLHTHDFRVLQTGAVQVETSGFHFEHSTICREIQAVLLLWEGVWYVQPSCNTWETFLDPLGVR